MNSHKKSIATNPYTLKFRARIPDDLKQDKAIRDQIQEHFAAIFNVNCNAIVTVFKDKALCVSSEPTYYYALSFDIKTKAHEMEHIAKAINQSKKCSAIAMPPVSKFSKVLPYIRIDGSLDAVLEVLKDFQKKINPAAKTTVTLKNTGVKVGINNN